MSSIQLYHYNPDNNDHNRYYDFYWQHCKDLAAPTDRERTDLESCAMILGLTEQECAAIEEQCRQDLEFLQPPPSVPIGAIQDAIRTEICAAVMQNNHIQVSGAGASVNLHFSNLNINVNVG
jgi:hypothetical protein